MSLRCARVAACFLRMDVCACEYECGDALLRQFVGRSQTGHKQGTDNGTKQTTNKNNGNYRRNGPTACVAFFAAQEFHHQVQQRRYFASCDQTTHQIKNGTELEIEILFKMTKTDTNHRSEQKQTKQTQRNHVGGHLQFVQQA